jgi:hypothetical protein
MKRSILPTALMTVLGLVTLLGSDATANGKAKQTRFVGVHPIVKAHGGGFCQIEAPHVHVWAPTDARLQYRDHDGDLYFVGDPVAYGYEGPRHSYVGHHPIHVDVVVGDDHDDVEYCYLDGPHYHGFEPAPVVVADFKVQGDAYWYIGKPAPVYVEARPKMIEINALYTPIVYARPVIAITTPPPGWIGISFGVTAPVVAVEARPAVVVERPRPRAAIAAGFSAEVVVPAPTLSVEVGLPGVYVGGGAGVHHHHHRDVIVVDKHKHKHKKGRGRWGRGRGH